MKRILLASAAGFIAVSLFLPPLPGDARGAPGVSCGACHPAPGSALPKNHQPVKGNNLAACLACHKPDRSGKAEANPFSTRMHAAHGGTKKKMDCMTCHSWTPGKSFGLKGLKGSWGAPDREDMGILREVSASWSSGAFLDNLHGKAMISCGGCHGKNVPKADDTVENSRCLSCHGPMDKLAERSEPRDFKDRNPHKSHLGEIACTVCHRAHKESKVLCLDCHRNFKMTVKGMAH
jgi:hypothetical protein